MPGNVSFILMLLCILFLDFDALCFGTAILQPPSFNSLINASPGVSPLSIDLNIFCINHSLSYYFVFIQYFAKKVNINDEK